MNLIRLLFRLFLGRRSVCTRGTLTVHGPRQPIHIHRDRFGIALVDAATSYDGFFAIGFCHGQDRAFQLEILLRVARGTVSEMVGPAGLPLDQLSRRIGFHRAAKQQLPLVPEDVREALQAYSEGVLAGVTVGNGGRAHEFALLGSTPTKWTPEDTLAFIKVLSFTLTSNWDAEIVRLKVLTQDGEQALKDLAATYPSWQPTSVPVAATCGTAVDRLAADLREFFHWIRPGGASNNWVVAPSQTRTKRPLLANDPHLAPTLPAHWYLLRVRTPEWMLVGASFVGGPTVLSGHNEYAAWGLTAGLVDNTDLFLEEIGHDQASVRQADGFVPCEVIEETIAIKGKSPHVEKVLITPRGPIISPALVGVPQALSLRAVWLDPHPIAGFFRLHTVKNFADFHTVCEHWPGSSQNLVYADTSGKIGYQLIGRSPVRKKGFGTIPLPGWDPEVGWNAELLPYEEMPSLVDPACGHIATANNRHTPEGQGPFLGVDFIDGYRVTAILRALEKRSDWDVAGMQMLQMDQHSIVWEEIRDIVLKCPPSAPDVELALSMLTTWDGIVGPDSAAASVYEFFLLDMMRKVAKAKAPKSWEWVVGAGLSPITLYNFGCFRRTAHLVRLLREQPADWFPGGWQKEIQSALAEAIRFLRHRFGPDLTKWYWGHIRPMMMVHPLTRTGFVGKALAQIFNLKPVHHGGDADVINQGAALPLFPLTPTSNIASVRTVIDVGAWQNSRYSLPAGQSGNPYSSHYADLMELWKRGEGVPIAVTAEEVKKAKVNTLTLSPAEG